MLLFNYTQIADQIHEMFNKSIYTLGVFIDLSKAFDTVNHKILLKKLSHYEIEKNSLDWFTCYLSNRKQFIGYNVKSKTTWLDIICGVPQESILGPLLFLLYLYLKNLPQSSKLLNPIMFADDTNLIYSGKVIHSLFNTVNNELSSISHWFNSNKLSLNADKTKFILFHKVRERDNIPVVLPTWKTNNTLTKRVDHIKFLESFDEILTWKSHINLIWKQNIKKVSYIEPKFF